jgi:hypothetical protein
MVALKLPAPNLRQESTVEIEDRLVTVVSEVLVEPELLIVTTVMEGDQCIKKTHLALPATLANDYRARGEAALVATLQLQHLRFVRLLLSRDDARIDQTPGEPGVLATLVLGASGEVVRRAGEEHVPGAWLRSAWVVAGMADSLSDCLDLGKLQRAEMHGHDLSAFITRNADKETSVRFVDPRVTTRERGGA